MTSSSPSKCCEKCRCSNAYPQEHEYYVEDCGVTSCPCHTAEKPVAEIKDDTLVGKVPEGFLVTTVMMGGGSEKPVQEYQGGVIKYIDKEGYLYGVPAAPVGEEWEKRWEAEIPLMQVSTHVGPRHLDENKVKVFISKLLQEEREKAHDGGLGVRMVEYTEAFDKGAGAERQRIEDATRALKTPPYPIEAETVGLLALQEGARLGWSNCRDEVLKIIHKEGEV